VGLRVEYTTEITHVAFNIPQVMAAAQLPEELLAEVFRHLPYKNVTPSLLAVCQAWKVRPYPLAARS
jgi:hypothetical protein